MRLNYNFFDKNWLQGKLDMRRNQVACQEDVLRRSFRQTVYRKFITPSKKTHRISRRGNGVQNITHLPNRFLVAGPIVFFYDDNHRRNMLYIINLTIKWGILEDGTT